MTKLLFISLVFMPLFVFAQPAQIKQKQKALEPSTEQLQLNKEQIDVLKQRVEALETERDSRFNSRNASFNILLTFFGAILTFVTLLFTYLGVRLSRDLSNIRKEASEARERAKKILEETEGMAKRETDRILQASKEELEKINECQKKAQEYSTNLRKINATQKVGDISIGKAEEIINDTEAPDSLQDWAHAIIAFGKRHYNEAIDKFDRLLLKEYERDLSVDELISVFSYLSDCCYKLAEVTDDKEDRKSILEKTLMYLDSYTTLFPLDNAYWSNKGDVFYKLATEEVNESLANKYKDEAIDCYDKAIVLLSDYDIAWNNKGVVLASYSDDTKTKEAIKCFDKAIRINPQDNVYNHRGLAHEKLRDTKKALKDFEKALKLNPSNAEAKTNKERLEKDK